MDCARIALVSDTHVPRFAKRLPRAVERIAAESPTHVLHCGDLTDLDALAPLVALGTFDAVAGNNDAPDLVVRFGRAKIVTVGRMRIGIVHGDGTRGTTADRARATFEPGSVDVIGFGHSHVPSCIDRNGVWIVNPGSPTDKRRRPKFSFAILDVRAGTCEPRLVFFL